MSLQQPILVLTVAMIGHDLKCRRPRQLTQQLSKRMDIPGVIIAVRHQWVPDCDIVVLFENGRQVAENQLVLHSRQVMVPLRYRMLDVEIDVPHGHSNGQERFRIGIAAGFNGAVDAVSTEAGEEGKRERRL